MTIQKLVAKTITPEDIHDLADVIGMPWDDDPKFMKMTKQVTGKERLDDLNPRQLLLVYNALVREGNRRQRETSELTLKKGTSRLFTIDEVRARGREYLKQHPELKAQLAQFETALTSPIVYHGTRANFKKFNLKKANEKAFFFTENKEHAETWGKAKPYRLSISKLLTISNKYIGTVEGWDNAANVPDTLIPNAKARGYDGILVKSYQDAGIATANVWLVWDPKKIKPMVEKAGAYTKDKMQRHEATDLARRISPLLKMVAKQYGICGSYRRGQAKVGDLDFVVTDCNLGHLMALLTEKLGATSAPRAGAGVLTVIIPYMKKKIQAEFVNVKDRSWGSAVLHSTGSGAFNMELRTYAKQKGYRLSQNGLIKVENERFIAGRTEEDVFNALGLDFIPPDDRNEGFWAIKGRYKLR